MRWQVIPAAYRDRNGLVDLTVIADDGTRQVPWFTSATPTVASSAAVLVPGVRADTIRFEFGDRSGVASSVTKRETVVGTSSNRDANGFTSVTAVTRTNAAMNRPDSGGPGSCSVVPGAWTYGVDERYAALYAWSGAHGSIKESNGAAHTLGVGYQVGSGGWSQNGTAGLSESSGSGASRSGVIDAWVHNRVNYRAYSVTCQGSTFHTRKAMSTYALLSSYTYAPHVTWGSCTRYTGGTYWKARGTNATIGGGVNLGFVSLTAQAGWNTDTEIAWTVTRGTKICGSSSAGWSASSQAEAHAG